MSTAVRLTTQVQGILPVANGGTGTSTAFTAGSVVFAGASGVYTQDNSNLFWDDTNNRLGVGTPAPTARLTASDNTTTLPAPPSGTVLHLSSSDGAVSRAVVDAFGSIPAVSFRRANNTAASPTALAQDDQFFNFSGLGYQSGGAYSTAARAQLTARALEAWTATAQGAYFTFDTNSAGTVTSPPTTRLTVADHLLVGAGRTSLPGSGNAGLIFADGTAPGSLASNTAGIYAEDDGTGNVRMYGINEDGVTGPLGLVQAKSTTGDPTGREGLFCINTFDNTFKVYADGAWRTLASGW